MVIHLILCTGTQRSFSSSSSGGDLSSRQLELLKQMLSTPNPTGFADPSSIRWPKGGSRPEMSSGSDHVTSDPSARGTKSTLNSASSLHDHRPSSVSRAQASSTNYPYSQGTWNSKNRTATGSNSRPNLSGVFPNDNHKSSKSQTASRGTLSGSSATGGVVTTDDTEEEVSDWDKDSSSDSGKAARKLAASKAPSSTASSSIDMSHQSRLSLTPETILPLLAYAREVKARLVDCLDELERARGRSRSTASPAPAHAPVPTQATSQRSTRGARAPEIGTSTLRRA